MDDFVHKKRSYTPPPMIESPKKEVEAPKKAVLSKFSIEVHNDGSYTEDVSPGADLVTVICVVNELQNVVAKLYKAQLDKEAYQRREMLARIPGLPGLPN